MQTDFKVGQTVVVRRLKETKRDYWGKTGTVLETRECLITVDCGMGFRTIFFASQLKGDNSNETLDN